MSDENAITTAKPATALAVQQDALTALLSDPERLNALDTDKLERLFDLNERMLAATSAKTAVQRGRSRRVQDQVDPRFPKTSQDRRTAVTTTRSRPPTRSFSKTLWQMLRPLLDGANRLHLLDEHHQGARSRARWMSSSRRAFTRSGR